MRFIPVVGFAGLCVAAVLVTAGYAHARGASPPPGASAPGQVATGGSPQEHVRAGDRLQSQMLLLYLAGGLLFAVVMTDGWSQVLASAALGPALYGLAVPFLEPPPGWTALATVRDWAAFGLNAGVSAGLSVTILLSLRGAFRSTMSRRDTPGLLKLVVWLWSVPYAFLLDARGEISPGLWQPAADAAFFSPTARADRLLLTYGALAGATAGALVGDWTVVGEVIRDLHQPFGLAAALLLAVLAAGFVVPLHEAIMARLILAHPQPRPPVQREHARASTRWSWYAVAAISLLGVELLFLALRHAVERDVPAAMITGAVSSMTAGTATYYWSAVRQAKARFMIRRATRAAVCFSAVILFPAVAIVVLAVYPFANVLGVKQLIAGGKTHEVHAPGEMLGRFIGVTVLPFLIAVAGALFSALLGFGAYTAAGGWAIERVAKVPLWLRVTLVLIVVDGLVSALLLAIFRALGDSASTLASLAGPDTLSVLGWGLALAINPRTKDILDPNDSRLAA